MKMLAIVNGKKRIIDLSTSISYFNYISKFLNFEVVEYININDYSNEELGRKINKFIRGE